MSLSYLSLVSDTVVGGFLGIKDPLDMYLGQEILHLSVVSIINSQTKISLPTFKICVLITYHTSDLPSTSDDSTECCLKGRCIEATRYFDVYCAGGKTSEYNAIVFIIVWFKAY